MVENIKYYEIFARKYCEMLHQLRFFAVLARISSVQKMFCCKFRFAYVGGLDWSLDDPASDQMLNHEV